MASSALGRNRSHTRPTAILRCGDPERCGDRGFKGSLLFWFKQGRNFGTPSFAANFLRQKLSTLVPRRSQQTDIPAKGPAAVPLGGAVKKQWEFQQPAAMRVFAVLVMLALPPCNAFAFGPSRCGVQGFFSRPQPVHQSALRPARAGVLGVRADVTVTLATPLGIVFEEVEPGQAKGLVVKDLVSNFPLRDRAGPNAGSIQLTAHPCHRTGRTRCRAAMQSATARSLSGTSSLLRAPWCWTRATR